jgi:hypothetical protein
MSDRLVVRRSDGDNGEMDKQDHLEEYLAICQAVYEQMKRDGTWPWAVDSTNPEDVIDSDSNPNNL